MAAGLRVTAPLNIAIVGAGWAGLAAAVSAIERGHTATVFEASSAIGGRARALKASLPDGTPVLLDNGQHILIGAYTQTLQLMRQMGVAPDQALLNLPMTLQFADGRGIRFPDWPTPLDALGGILAARGWCWRDKWALLRAAVGWQLSGFACAPGLSVATLCQALPRRVNDELIEPLCVSALNTPAAQASASVFLRVLRDALLGVAGGSHLLLPRTDLGALLPDAAAAWITRHGGQIHLHQRIASLQQHAQGWRLRAHLSAPEAMPGDPPAPMAPSAPAGVAALAMTFDAVLLATPALNSALALTQSAQHVPDSIASQLHQWAAQAGALQHEAIATVYAWADQARLAQPMLALRSGPGEPAQFAFDRGQLHGPAGLLAFVVSAAQGDRLVLQAQVLAQAQRQLGLRLQPLQTIVERRATFACTPGLLRPPALIAPGLLACGDYVDGPYPATLEGAVLSAQVAVRAL